MTIKVKVTPNLKEVSKKLEIAASKVKNAKAAHYKASIILDQWVLQNFRSEGGKVGNWEPLKDGGRYKKNLGFDSAAQILQDTNTLRRSFTPFHTQRSAGIGSEIVYSKPHNEGNYRLPSRRMLPDRNIDSALMLKLLRLYENHVKGVTK